MVNAKQHIISKLKPILKELTLLDLSDNDINLDPASEKFGDYTTNVAMQAFKVVPSPNLPTPPYYSRKIAAKASSAIELADKIKAAFVYPDGVVEKLEVAKPGFINFWLSKDYLLLDLKKSVELGFVLKNKKIMVEFTDPNPFKLFHIGHLYSNVVGEAIARLLEGNGAKVARANYQGDVGLHVAKAIWGILNQESKIKSVENKSLEEKVKFLGESYTKGDKAFESDEKAKKEIIELNKKIYEKSDPKINELYKKGRKWSLDYFETVYKKLGTKFDFYYFESESGRQGLKIVHENLKKRIFKQSQGAIIFEGSRFGLHNRVFVTSQSLPTYEAKDLGLSYIKYRDYAFDQSIIITGNEVNEYFKVVMQALMEINPTLAKKTKHISHGMVRIAGGKISSRLGNLISYEWLVDSVEAKISEQFKDMDEETKEKVSLGAIKYAFLKSRIGQDIEFDLGKSVSLEGDSGPYLQYAFVRTQSVLAKSKFKAQNSKLQLKIQNLEFEELLLLRTLIKFQDIVEEAGVNFSPNILTSFLFSLSQRFNLFYQKYRILKSENQEFRLNLTEKVGLVLQKGLFLLGVETPSKM